MNVIPVEELVYNNVVFVTEADVVVIVLFVTAQVQQLESAILAVVRDILLQERNVFLVKVLESLEKNVHYVVVLDVAINVLLVAELE